MTGSKKPPMTKTPVVPKGKSSAAPAPKKPAKGGGKY